MVNPMKYFILEDLRSPTFPKLRKKIVAFTHGPKGVKTKNQRLSRSLIWNWKIVGAQLVTLSFSPKFGIANGPNEVAIGT